jgi:hypothetical protein
MVRSFPPWMSRSGTFVPLLMHLIFTLSALQDLRLS